MVWAEKPMHICTINLDKGAKHIQWGSLQKTVLEKLDCYRQKNEMRSLSYCCCLVAKSCPTLLWPHGISPWDLSMDFPWDFPLSMGFSRQEYWRALSFPYPEDLANLGIEPMSLALAGGFFTTEPLGKLMILYHTQKTTQNVLKTWM